MTCDKDNDNAFFKVCEGTSEAPLRHVCTGQFLHWGRLPQLAISNSFTGADCPSGQDLEMQMDCKWVIGPTRNQIGDYIS